MIIPFRSSVRSRMKRVKPRLLWGDGPFHLILSGQVDASLNPITLGNEVTSMPKVDLADLCLGSREESLMKIFHLVSFRLNAEMAAEGDDETLIGLLYILQSYLSRTYPDYVHDDSKVDWEQSLKTMLPSLEPDPSGASQPS